MIVRDHQELLIFNILISEILNNTYFNKFTGPMKYSSYSVHSNQMEYSQDPKKLIAQLEDQRVKIRRLE